MSNFIPKPLKRFAICIGVLACVSTFLSGCALFDSVNADQFHNLARDVEGISSLTREMALIAAKNADALGDQADEFKTIADKTAEVAGTLRDVAADVQASENEVAALIAGAGKVGGMFIPGPAGPAVEGLAALLASLYAAKVGMKMRDGKRDTRIQNGGPIKTGA